MAETSDKPLIKVLIMCGGRGTRMWPISKMGHPKQFEGLLGKKSMFRATVERALTGFKAEDIYLATGKDFARHLKKQAPEIPGNNFILEPVMRDNLGAILLDALVIHQRYPGAVMIFMWGADHIVQDVPKFIKVLKAAAKKAHQTDKIVFIDSKPTYASVHQGWMKLGAQVDTVDNFKIFKMIKQVEKPDLKTAQKFFESKRYAIHTGYMAVKAGVLIDLYKKYAPGAYRIGQRIQAAIGKPEFDRVLNQQYPGFEKTSVDYGLLEKLPEASQLELMTDFGWIDVGTWELLYHGLAKDKNGNIVFGQAELIETTNSLVISRDNKVIGLIGVDNLIVVDTPDGLLVCNLNKAPLVKQLYKKLFEK